MRVRSRKVIASPQLRAAAVAVVVAVDVAALADNFAMTKQEKIRPPPDVRNVHKQNCTRLRWWAPVANGGGEGGGGGGGGRRGGGIKRAAANAFANVRARSCFGNSSQPATVSSRV